MTPDQVLDPGTTYYVDDSITVPTTPEADCLGAPGGSGAEFTYDDPNALSLLATAARATKSVRPLSLSDQFGFGLAICGIGGVEAGPGEFWYLKSNHEESSFGADQLTVASGDEILFYLAPDNFPAPNPAELELQAPAAANGGDSVEVSVIEHACATDQTTFEVTCTASPAAGVTISGGTSNASDGRRRHRGRRGRRLDRARRDARHRHPLRGALGLRPAARPLPGEARQADRRQSRRATRSRRRRARTRSALAAVPM